MEQPHIAAPGEPHLACVLLVDTSISMEGEPIDNLNKAINDFKAQTAMDEMAQKRVDLAIVQFDYDARVVQDFTPINRMEPIKMTADGNTNMGAGINMAIDMLKERNKFYASLGTPCFKPWIFMITDGAPNGPEEEYTRAKERIKEEEEKGSGGKLKFFALGVPGYDKAEMFRLLEHQGEPEKRRVLELSDTDFSGIFNWMSESMVAISVSRVDEAAPPLPRLPENATRADPRDVSDL